MRFILLLCLTILSLYCSGQTPNARLVNDTLVYVAPPPPTYESLTKGCERSLVPYKDYDEQVYYVWHNPKTDKMFIVKKHTSGKKKGQLYRKPIIMELR